MDTSLLDVTSLLEKFYFLTTDTWDFGKNVKASTVAAEESILCITVQYSNNSSGTPIS